MAILRPDETEFVEWDDVGPAVSDRKGDIAMEKIDVQATRNILLALAHQSRDLGNKAVIERAANLLRDLRDELGYWHSRAEEAESHAEKQQAEIEELRATVAAQEATINEHRAGVCWLCNMLQRQDCAKERLDLRAQVEHLEQELAQIRAGNASYWTGKPK